MANLRCRLPDRKPLGEVVQADADGDEQREPTRGRPGRDTAGPQRRDLRLSHRPRADPARRAHPSHELLPRDEGEQADRDAAGEQQAVAEHGRQPAGVLVDAAERAVDRLPRRAENVPDQKDQDADGDRIEDRAKRLGAALHSSDGKAEQDRDAGDEAEQEGMRETHRRKVRQS